MEVDATKLIPNFDKGSANVWFAQLKSSITEKNPTFLQKYPDDHGGSLYTVGDQSNGYYYLVVDDSITYFVRYRAIKGNGNKFGRQVLVARVASSIESSGLALHVFYHYLLPRFKSIISDTMQTERGKAFWDYALAKAFQRNLYVYYFDRRNTPNKLVRMENREDLKKYHSAIWGTDEGHLRTHAVISSVPLRIGGSKE